MAYFNRNPLECKNLQFACQQYLEQTATLAYLYRFHARYYISSRNFRLQRARQHSRCITTGRARGFIRATCQNRLESVFTARAGALSTWSYGNI